MPGTSKKRHPSRPRRLTAVPGTHQAVPQPGTVYSIGPRNAGLPANLGNELDHPIEAVCRCDKRIVRDTTTGDGSRWRHEERQP